LAEVLIEEENENIEHIRILEELLTTEPQNGLQILKGSIRFRNELVGTSKLLTKGEDINDFSPVQLFEKRLEQDASIESTQDFVNAFKEIMESLQSSDSID
jgi:exonuclease SbcD